ncbi:hypothetical protein P3X46_026481 [Hevea brasiliensis]|uniref:DUF4283 domain-containing protein n=1 Tax=Hevea brasiliensis TaxID=3981 RepID=A0ABQ9KY86_HEVBR|nr:hypothetical protein P3X46_026481 [Hevea brasiliensis]
MSLIDEEEESFRLDPLLSEGTPAFSEFYLIEKFLTDRQINLGAMRETLSNLWRPGKGVCIEEIGPQLFLFQFFHQVDLNRVIEGGPWSFNNHLVITHHLKPGEIPAQIHDLPVGFNTEAVAQKLGNFIGKFLFYDSINSFGGWKTYMRVRVLLDTRQPLKRWKKSSDW